MEMLVLMGLAIAGFILVSVIMPWVNMARIRGLEAEIVQLKKFGIGAPDEMPPMQDIGADLTETTTPWKEAASVAAAQTAQVIKTPKVKASDSSWGDDLAHHLSTKFPVWIGGIALALAGFFMVKYSIENELLSPVVRVVLGAAFGLALLAAGHYGRSITHFANGERITQSLTGAGISVLYIVSFASSELYQLVPLWFGFAMMAATTATAVVLSVRHGVPIALLGMLGGFLTPAVMSADSPSAATLFIYLYAIYTGLMIVIQRERWWILSIPTLCGAFLWVIIWLASGSMAPTDSVWIGLFLLAISMSMVMTARDDNQHSDTLLPEWNYRSVTNYLGLAGALALMGVTAYASGFQLMDWLLYALLAAGSIALAYFQPRNYALVPLASLAITAVMLMGWRTDDYGLYAAVLIGFAALYVASGYFMLWRAKHPILWAFQMAFAAIGLYVLAYYRLADVWEMNALPYVWGAIALMLAAAISYVLDMVRRSDAFDVAEQQNLLGLFLVAGTSLVSLALAIEVKGEFLSIAFAAEMLAVSWIHSHLRLPFMRVVIALLLGVFAYLLLPQILLLVQLSAYSLVEAKLHLQQGVPMVDWPAFQLGVPALLLVGTSVLLRKDKDSRVVQALECAAIALLAVMGYYLMRHAFHVDADVLFKKAALVERGVTTNALFVMGLVCFWIGRHYSRSAVSLSGSILAGTALFRILYFDFLAYNPIWSGEKVGGMILVNGLILPYLLPIIWLYRVAAELKHLHYGKVAAWLKASMLLLAFTWVSFTVRYIFQGDNLSANGMGSAENYVYSVAWLLFGLTLVFVGAWKKDRAMHHASLAIILIVVGKAFLYDASELEGLYRVFSFLGLGISLIGISYFFSRFVYLPDKK